MIDTETTRRRIRLLVLAGVLFTAPVFRAAPSADPGAGDAAVITIEQVTPGEARRRPAVAFDHGKHTEALKQEGCSACHAADADGRLHFAFRKDREAVSPDRLKAFYHDACMGCHRERRQSGATSAPLACGGCHVKGGGPASAHDEMAFDYSLHGRHVTAMEQKCERCHHVYDEQTERLTYVKGKSEDACSDCHKDVDEGRTRSLRRAAHRMCVNCHLAVAESGKAAGPTACAGCHDASVVATYRKLPADQVARLVAGQPDSLWIHAPDARFRAVGFDHRAHEPGAVFCTTCHHATRRPCRACHTVSGKEEGGFVTLEAAYHTQTSVRSCSGCHHRKAQTRDCRGCHDGAVEGRSERLCRVCHNAPPSAEGLPVTVPGTAMAPLPKLSDDGFPETVVIRSLAQNYEPSTMPHAKIVSHLDRAVTESRLASGFHGSPDVLCTGCHHHAVAGVRPVPCANCHSGQPEPESDKPALKVAYHRQCLGCHRRMHIENALDCTGCHRIAAREVSE